MAQPPHRRRPGRGGRHKSWRRGSIGTSRVWDDARRAAHRSGGIWPASDASVDEGPGVSTERLAEIVSLAVSSTVRDLFPELDAKARTRIDEELRHRIADLIEGKELPKPAPPPKPKPIPPQAVPVAPEDIDPLLADRIRANFDRLGAGMHAMKVLRETAITLILRTVHAERGARESLVQPSMTPKEQRQVDNLERRIAKLTSSIAKTREALAKIGQMQDFDPGIPSIYKDVQGLAPVDEDFQVKRELLGDIFDANLKLQRDLRRLGPKLDPGSGTGDDLDGPRRNQVA